MAVTTSAFGATTRPVERAWLHSRDWDLTFISLSVVLVAAPYLIYLGLLHPGLDSLLSPIAEKLGASMDSLSRNAVNGIVALIVGGPHMYATFTRTALDKTYVKKHPRMLMTSLAIPVVVVTLALINLQLLLTMFFFWASIHVLHQIIFITELYNHRQTSAMSAFSRFADYPVVLTSLYPLAAYKMVQGEFSIGPNDIGAVVNNILGVVGLSIGPWMIWLAGGMFAVSLGVWLAKSFMEWRQGTLPWPKTLFIGLTVTAAFFVPALGNLDTAFQGMNVWHSLQYLALTWMLNHIRQRRGELDNSPFVKRLSTDNTGRKFYLFNIGLTIADVILAGVIFLVLRYVFGQSFDFAFDRSYYIAVLSFLWIHYYHDHFLFGEPQVIEMAEPA
jgi:hypothetical protein